MSKPHFRAGVVAVVRGRDGKVLAFNRADLPDAWQLPQGGIERGESPRDAAWRELAEETGLTRDDVRLVGEFEHWTVYSWPAEMRDSERLGQAHRWFFFEPIRDGCEPRPDGSEFDSWQWMSPDELIARVIEFRRHPYRQALGERRV